MPMAMKTDRAQHASYALVHHVQGLLLAALSIGTIMTSATILSTMAMVLPGAGAGVVGMDGAAGMAGVLTIVVGLGVGGGTRLGMADGTTLGTDLLGAATLIGHGTHVRSLLMHNQVLEGDGPHAVEVVAQDSPSIIRAQPTALLTERQAEAVALVWELAPTRATMRGRLTATASAPTPPRATRVATVALTPTAVAAWAIAITRAAITRTRLTETHNANSLHSLHNPRAATTAALVADVA